MDKLTPEERRAYRRALRERRRQARSEQERRKSRDRRSREAMQGALARAKARAASAPKPPVVPPESPETSKITLYDIVLRSLQGIDASQFAAELAKQKVVSSVEAATRLLAETPATLTRYGGHEAASAVFSSLKAAGADVVLKTSRVTCSHCGSAVPCEGEADASKRGVMFTCPVCQARTYLDSRDRKFHPVLQCDSCKSLLNLPAEGRAGKYRCKCGSILDYKPFQPGLEFLPEDEEDNP